MTRSFLHHLYVGFVAFGLSAGRTTAQTITVATPVQISPAGTGHHWFTTIVADPGDARHLMTCGIREAPRQNSWQGFVYTSHDGGASWAVALVDSSSQNVSEETCAFGPDAAAYFIAEPWSSGFVEDESVLHLYRSQDRGHTWSGPVTNSWLDYARMAVDNTSGPHRGRLYAFGNVSWVKDPDGTTWSDKELVSSADGGRTLSKRVRLPRPTTYRTLGNYPEYTRVLPSGTVLAVYWTGYLPLSPDSVKVPQRFLIEAVRAVDGGQRPVRPIVIARMTGARMVGIAPGMDVDTTRGQWGGRVYVTWSDSVGGRERVFLATSADEAVTWSTPRVIDDTPGATGGRPDRGPSAASPSLAVNKDGIVGVTWVEQHRDCWRFAASLDGGASFLPSVPLNLCPRNELVGRQYFADYLWAVSLVEFESPLRPDTTRSGFTIRVHDTSAGGLTAAADGGFHPLWALPHDAGGRLWTTTVTVGRQRAAPSRVTTVAGLADVTSHIGYTFTNAEYDETTQTVSVDVSLFNKDTTALWAPICLRVVEVRSPIATVAVANADNKLPGPGAIWDLSSSVEGGVLRAYQQTHPQRLVFTIKNFTQPAPADYVLSLVAVEERVFARASSR